MKLHVIAQALPRLRLLALVLTLLVVFPAAPMPASAAGTDDQPAFVPLLTGRVGSFFATPEGVYATVRNTTTTWPPTWSLYHLSRDGAVLRSEPVGFSIAVTSDEALITMGWNGLMYARDGAVMNLSADAWTNLAFGPDGALYGMASDHQLVRLSEAREARIMGAFPFRNPQHFAFDAQFLHVAHGKQIITMDPATGARVATTNLSWSPQRIAFDTAGSGYAAVATEQGAEVRRFTPGGNATDIVIRLGDVSVQAMAFSGNDLYVARCIREACELGYYADVAEGFAGHQAAFRPIPVGDLVVSAIRSTGTYPARLTIEVSNEGACSTIAGARLEVYRSSRVHARDFFATPVATLQLPAMAPGDRLNITFEHQANLHDQQVETRIFGTGAGGVLLEENWRNNHRIEATRGLVPTGLDGLRG